MSAPHPSLVAAAERLEELAPGYLERVRSAAAALGLPATAAARARAAAAVLDERAEVSPDVPLVSSRRSGRVLKKVMARLTRFYFVYVTDQATDLGVSTAWLSRALVEQVAEAEARLAGLETEVAALREQLATLRGDADPAGGPAAGGPGRPAPDEA